MGGRGGWGRKGVGIHQYRAEFRTVFFRVHEAKVLPLMFENHGRVVLRLFNSSTNGIIWVEYELVNSHQRVDFDQCITHALSRFSTRVSLHAFLPAAFRRRVTLSRLFDVYVASILSAVRRFCFEPLPSVSWHTFLRRKQQASVLKKTPNQTRGPFRLLC